MKALFRRLVPRLVPDSLLGQLFALLCIGIVLLQIINLLIVDNMQQSYMRQTQNDRIGAMTSRYFMLDPLPPAQRDERLIDIMGFEAGESWNIVFTLLATPPAWPRIDDPGLEQRIESIVNNHFQRKGMSLPGLQMRIYRDAADLPVDAYVQNILSSSDPARFPVLEMALRLRDGSWLSIMQSMKLDAGAIIGIQRLQLFAVAAVSILLMAVVLIRVTRPLNALSRAAEQFGHRPETVSPLAEQGSREVRETIQSFNRMRHMIQNHFTERDRMLVAMAHDLRTPLTRLQLWLEEVEPESLRGKLTTNCQEIQSIANQSMELARSLQTTDVFVSLDIHAFAQSVVDDYRAEGKNVVLLDELPESVRRLMVRPLCLKRCVDNLINNALRYAGNAEVLLGEDKEDKECIFLEIRDDGPGIPPEALEHVFEPYYRLESSRNRDSGGAGLGLTIASNMALHNDAELTLCNRAQGGLSARLAFRK
jgi:signal transduction histidine kinase